MILLNFLKAKTIVRPKTSLVNSTVYFFHFHHNEQKDKTQSHSSVTPFQQTTNSRSYSHRQKKGMKATWIFNPQQYKYTLSLCPYKFKPLWEECWHKGICGEVPKCPIVRTGIWCWLAGWTFPYHHIAGLSARCISLSQDSAWLDGDVKHTRISVSKWTHSMWPTEHLGWWGPVGQRFNLKSDFF